MKRYLVFSGEDYYPLGGWKDVAGDHARRLNALAHARSLVTKPEGHDWAHVIDTTTGETVGEYEREVEPLPGYLLGTATSTHVVSEVPDLKPGESVFKL